MGPLLRVVAHGFRVSKNAQQMVHVCLYANEALKAKSVVPNADIVSELVAKGEVELGVIVVTQILTTPGVELVGPLPQELRITSSFVGAISSQAKAPEAARDLIAFLKTPAAVKVMRAQGMEPLF